MPTDEQKRWHEISPYLDEALDLEAAPREQWLRELDVREPAIAAAVRSLLAEREGLDSASLLTDGRTAALPRVGLAGQQLGAYTLDSMLGHGGMGTVWLAHRSDGRYEGRAAVKLLNASLLGRPAEQRFVREGSMLAKLRHPNIAQLTDAGVAPSGQPYLVLEYVQGERIDRYAEQQKLSIDARIRLFLDVLAAVAHAHRHLIVHRDIKPPNILVTPDGVVKLLDFGIATLLGPDDAQLTRDVAAGLTPEYAAPEQLLNQPVTTATDVYALGLVLSLLLTGKHPHGPEGKSVPELARATLDVETPRLSALTTDAALGRELRGDLDNIVAKALKKDPEERYSTAETFAQDLRAFLACQPVSAQPDTIAYRASKFMRRHRGGVVMGAIIALVLIGAVVMTTWQMIEARKQRDVAVYQSQRAEFQARFAYQIMSEVGSDGRPITIRQLMDKGIDVLDKSYGDDPRFVIDMLVNMSGRYMDLGDTDGEYAALVKAEGLARKLADADAIAKVQCNTVETELALGKPQQARERMSDGLVNLGKLATPSYDRTTECGMAQTRLLWADGKLPEAVEAGTKVARVIEAAHQQDEDVAYQTITSMLERILIESGRWPEGREWNLRAMAALERSGREGTLSMSGAQHNQAGYLFHGGEVRAALELQRKVVERLVAQQGIDNLAAGYAGRLGLLLVRSGEIDAGFTWLDRAVAGAVARNNQLEEIGSMLNRARAHVMVGHVAAALADVEAAERIARADGEGNRDALRGARLIRAQALAAGARSVEALAELESLLNDMSFPRVRVGNRLPEMLLLRARLELALGRNSAALATAQDALKLTEAETRTPDQSADVGAALMILAAAQRATGDPEGARASARRASGALTAGLGPDHSETRAALQFR